MTPYKFLAAFALWAICIFLSPSASAQTDSIRHKVFFESGSFSLDSKAVKFIDSVAGRLNRYARYKIYLYGHTDDVGSTETNLALANKRVETVLAKLRQIGIDSSHVLGKGSGEENPLFPNTTEQNRSLNRRVDISVVRWDKDTLIKLGDCGEVFIPKGAFSPMMIEDIDFSTILVDNSKAFETAGLPSKDVQGNELLSAGMLQWKATVSGKPAKRNLKKSIEFRLCNKYGLDKTTVYCLKTVNGTKVWEATTIESKIENGKIITKLPADCDQLNFTTPCMPGFNCCHYPFLQDYLPAKGPNTIYTDNFTFSHNSTSKVDFRELPTTCDRIQLNVQENISNEQYIAKGRYFNISVGKSKGLETIPGGKVLFALPAGKPMPTFYTYDEENASWGEYNGAKSTVYKGASCTIFSLSVTGSGVYAIVDSMGTFEKNVNLKTKKYKPETVYIHYKPQLKKGKKTVVNGPIDEHFFKFSYATSIPVLGDNNNNTIIIADTDNPDAMKVTRKKITDLRFKRKKQYFLVKKKLFEPTTDASKETAKLCKGKKR